MGSQSHERWLEELTDLIDRIEAGGTAPSQETSTDATVLVADDDELVRRVVGEGLADSGYRILFADSALTALAIDEPIDVALVDGQLDRRRRSDLGGELRRRDPGIRIVVMTGLPGTEDYEFADAVLAKPFGFDELRATIARLLNGR